MQERIYCDSPLGLSLIEGETVSRTTGIQEWAVEGVNRAYVCLVSHGSQVGDPGYSGFMSASSLVSLCLCDGLIGALGGGGLA